MALKLRPAVSRIIPPRVRGSHILCSAQFKAVLYVLWFMCRSAEKNKKKSEKQKTWASNKFGLESFGIRDLTPSRCYAEKAP